MHMGKDMEKWEEYDLEAILFQESLTSEDSSL